MSQKATYQQLLSQHAAIPPFFRDWWLDIVCSGTWDVALADGGQKDIAVAWPYQIERKAGLTIIRNPPLTPYLGPYFLFPDDLSEASRLAKEDKMYETLWSQISKYDCCDVQCIPGYLNYIPFAARGFERQINLTYKLSLKPAEEELLKNIKEDCRHSIRQSSKEMTITESGTDTLDEFFRMYAATFERKQKKQPVSSSLFKKLITETVNRNAGTVLTAQNSEGVTCARIFVVWDSQTMYYLISAMNTQTRYRPAVSGLVWAAIRKAKEMGLSYFDFEGSSNPGIEAFFRRFGGTRHYYLSMTHNRSFLWKLKRAIMG